MKKRFITLKKDTRGMFFGILTTLVFLNIVIGININITRLIFLLLCNIYFVVLSYFMFFRLLLINDSRLIVYGDLRIDSELQLQTRINVKFYEIENIEMGFLKKGLNTDGKPYKKRIFYYDSASMLNELQCIILTLKNGVKKRIIVEFIDDKKVKRIFDSLKDTISSKL